jgi:hypothetical protein
VTGELWSWSPPEGEGTGLLDDVETFLRRFVAFPSESTRVATVLWAAHAHAVDRFESTPRLALLSPEPGSGKTRVLEILELLVPRPLFSLNSSPAALFRLVADRDGPPTVLVDEADAIFGPRAGKDHEDLRAFVNAGHRRGAKAHRCVVRGKEISVEEFPAYAAVALAGLDDLPDTIMSRSMVVRMRKRAPYEQVEPYRHRIHAPEGHELRGRLAAWVDQVGYELESTFPKLPDGVEDRRADVWEPLLAVAWLAGGDWAERARVAAVADVAAAAQGEGTNSLRVRLLADLHTIFGNEPHLPTMEILSQLNALEESPWGDLRGRLLDARGLARRLAKFEVKPVNVRTPAGVVKGYRRADLVDVWARYLPSPSPRGTAATTATPATCAHGMDGGDQPDPWLGGRLSCPQCALSVTA